ncbi:MAG: PocR ligand-binding domain-containing protein [Candidatus Sumerlaeota bacterium]|nr:PocR ligand-binding domain-containing protein [Candidatus Sumerlaeota bacterium]
MIINNTYLKEMVSADMLQALLESFGNVCKVGSGIFTPTGERIGTPAHHGPVCSLLSKTPEGRIRCEACDRNKIKALIAGDKSASDPYPCHAGLMDFCEPIYCTIAGEIHFIGVFFAGQVLPQEVAPTSATVRQVRMLAINCNLDMDDLLAGFLLVPRVSSEHIANVRAWMRHFADLIGRLIQKKAISQNLLLSVIDVADDQLAVAHTIRDYLQPAAVSIFLQEDESRDQGPNSDRSIRLVATTFDPLMVQLPVALEREPRSVSYRRGEGLTGWVYDTGQVLHISDVREATQYPAHPYTPEWIHKVKEIEDLDATKSYLGVPIRARSGVTVGVIRAVRLKGDPDFDGSEVELLAGIAALLSSTFFKANLARQYQHKLSALNQAETLLRTLTEPGASLAGIAARMVSELAHIYLGNANWRAVYVLQHMRASRQFRTIAFAPLDLDKEYHAVPFADHEGVAGLVLHSGIPFASKDCRDVGVIPTTPWRSVVCVPIFQGSELWGAVSLCGQEVSQAHVDEVLPEIDSFARNISIVCQLSEFLDAKRVATNLAANVMSLNLEAHEVYKSLEAAELAISGLRKLVDGAAASIAEDISVEIADSLSWADVCVELGRYIRLCEVDPSTAVESYREAHIPREPGAIADNGKFNPWESFDLRDVVKRALAAVDPLARASNIACDSDCGTMSCPMIGDPNLLYRAMRNLMENAIVHAVVEKNESWTFRHDVKLTVRLDTKANESRTRFLVSDNGVGMAPHKLVATREIYSDPTGLGRTSHAPGFGTMVVAFAVGVHKGTISVESIQGQGTTVDLQLPTNREQET